ncbi:protein prenylyltransferase [Teratosphaeria nubilosa]|uniref:Protein farnesyltransferase/geranylgeranyltransferase type-1 subunit alpha n=1 Tax=Teratosphaeria nubilosa TaxID=161662 RepID=A0A6G1LA78_9PEZI|nr:protein prenylyltransferase [Teratosphaeria nubilosa]
MGKYSDDPAWADMTPIPLQEPHTAQPLAAIAYSDEYAECSAYLRAVMAANDLSRRVLDLTEDLIDMNPAHYTVWLYRAKCLFALDADLEQELEWLDEVALGHQKNYQIWHHRFLLLGKLGDGVDGERLAEVVQGERQFVGKMFEMDAKNYHVWSYRQWLVKRFGLWEDGELEFTEAMLEKDVRNNSVWNHRWYVVNGREGEAEGGVSGVVDPKIRERETEVALKAIARAPQNQSPWNYLRGIARKSGMSLKHLKKFAELYADLERPDSVKSSFALDLLAEILAEEKEEEKAGVALDLLARKYDPVRKNYWEYRKGLLGLSAGAAVA